MEAGGRPFADVLAEAQRLGYAEADPSMDVGGWDAAHKLAILAAIAFASRPDLEHVRVEGIEDVTLTDIRMAGKLGYRIKLIATGVMTEGGVSMHVGPALLGADHPLVNVSGSLNALADSGVGGLRSDRPCAWPRRLCVRSAAEAVGLSAARRAG
jgi:homoserine dehydrogenase